MEDFIFDGCWFTNHCPCLVKNKKVFALNASDYQTTIFLLELTDLLAIAPLPRILPVVAADLYFLRGALPMRLADPPAYGWPGEQRQDASITTLHLAVVAMLMFSYADSYNFVANLSNVNINIWTAKHIQYFKKTIQLYNTVKLFHFYRYKV